MCPLVAGGLVIVLLKLYAVVVPADVISVEKALHFVGGRGVYAPANADHLALPPSPKSSTKLRTLALLPLAGT